jgi:hypothetical protein
MSGDQGDALWEAFVMAVLATATDASSSST